METSTSRVQRLGADGRCSTPQSRRSRPQNVGTNQRAQKNSIALEIAIAHLLNLSRSTQGLKYYCPSVLQRNIPQGIQIHCVVLGGRGA